MNAPSRPHRIAGGAIIVRDDRILLVRYRHDDGSTYLAAPGGGALEHESVADAAVRETWEETGVRVAVGRLLLVEDILATKFKMCKIWHLAEVVDGEVTATDGARVEGIVEARWYTRPELDAETVFPWIIKAHDWTRWRSPGFVALASPARRATF